MKKCSKCKEIKSPVYFNKNPATKSKLSSWCKDCFSQYQKRYRQTPNAKNSQKRYYHSGKGKECHKKYANSQKGKESIRASSCNNKLQKRLKKFNLPEGTFSYKQFESLKQVYSFTCPRCLLKEPEITLTVDHIVPISRNGNNNINNIQLLCHSCNNWKGNRFIIKYDIPNIL